MFVSCPIPPSNTNQTIACPSNFTIKSLVETILIESPHSKFEIVDSQDERTIDANILLQDFLRDSKPQKLKLKSENFTDIYIENFAYSPANKVFLN